MIKTRNLKIIRNVFAENPLYIIEVQQRRGKDDEKFNAENLVPPEVAGDVGQRQVCLSLGTHKREYVNDINN
jgi:hypothetical protein